MKKKQRSLLSEELKRYKMISEYSFYKGDEEDNYDIDNLILGEDDENPEETDEFTPMGDEGNYSDEDGMDQEPQPMQQEPAQPAPQMQPQGDEVELDVTQLVNGTDEVKMTADLSLKKMEEILSQFKELESKLDSMSAMSAKIDNLENEIVTRNPKPVEKLEMRSLNSYPYSIKLSDYWNQKHPGYDPLGSKEEADKEYVLKQSDIDNEYNDSDIKKSFKDYEEEEF
jgi:TolA-binding protein